MATADSDGRSLAEQHLAGSAEPDHEGSLLNYAECARSDDWTLRSALVRLAQPEPLRASAVLELVRRTDSALHPLAKELERHTVESDPALASAGLRRYRGSHPHRDPRAADIARLLEARPHEHDALLGGYESVAPLTREERAALPLLHAALELDVLAEVLTRWAAAGPEHPPVELVDSVSGAVFALLEQHGVPRETGPPQRSRRSS